MRLLLGLLIASTLLGCREVVLDPAGRHPAPVVETPDPPLEEDAATPTEPIPDWAVDGAPPPAFPPPP